MFMFRLLFRLIVSAVFLYPLTTHAFDRNKGNASVLVTPYEFPIENPWMATLSTVFFVKPSKQFDYKTVTVVLHPERSKFNRIGDRNQVNIAFFKQRENPSAPLIFLIPGIGGNSRFPRTIYIGDLLYQAGFNVVTVPATMSSQFTLGISRTGYPGYSPRDAEDMLEFMKHVDSKLRNEENISPTRYALMGFSLGALDSGFIAKLDLQKHYFNFERVLMVNPPIQKARSIDAIDSLVLGSRHSIDDLIDSDSDGDQRLTEFQKDDILEPLSYLSFDRRKRGFADAELAWLIGANFRRSLSNVILASQDVYELNAQKSKSKEILRPLGRAETIRYSFNDYVNQILLKDINSTENNSIHFQTSDELIATSDLREVLRDLTNQQIPWAVFHNQNDFIFHNGDLEFLCGTHSASRVYPLGGHIGNIWYMQNQEDIVRFFEPLNH